MKGRRHNDRIKQVSEKLGIPSSEVQEVISTFYEAIYSKLENIKVDTDVMYTEEEFNKKFKSVLLPSVGTYIPSYKKYCSIKKRLNNKI